MNRLIFLLVVCLLLPCSCGKKVDSMDNMDVASYEGMTEAIQVVESLDIRFEAQDVLRDGKRKVVLWLKNPTDIAFTGTIQAYLVDSNSKVLTSHTIVLGEVKAQGGTWSVFYVHPKYLTEASIKYKWLSFELRKEK